MSDRARLDNAPESELVEAARQGDRAALLQLVRQHLDHAWRIGWRILRDRDETLGVVRESFVAAQRTLPAYDGTLPFRTWVARIVTTRAVKLLERGGDSLRTESATPAQPVAVADLEASEQERRVVACMGRLPGPLRAVLALRDVEGLGWDEVETLLALPQGASRARLARARHALRRCVTGQPIAAGAADRTREEAISAVLDDEPSERASGLARLGDDAGARAILAELEVLRPLAAREVAPPAPPELLAAIESALPAVEAGARLKAPRSKLQSKPPGPALPPWAVGAVLGLAVAVAAAWIVYDQGWFGVATQFVRERWAARYAGAAETPPGASSGADAAAVPGTSPTEASANPRGAEVAPVGDATAPGTATSPPPGVIDASVLGTAEAVPTTPPAADWIAPGTAGADHGQAGASGGGGDPPQAATAGVGAPSPTATGSAAAGPTAAARATSPAAPTISPAPAPTPGLAPVPSGGGAITTLSAPVRAGSASCATIWQLPAAGPLRWSGAHPANPPLVLGGLARGAGGEGFLVGGSRPQVRILVPRERWGGLAAELRKAGVVVPEAQPPGDVECAAAFVEAGPPPT